MKFEQVRKLHPAVKDLMKEVQDDEIDAHPDVAALLARRDAAQHRVNVGMAELAELTPKRTEAEERIQTLAAKIREIEEGRVALAKRIFLGEADDSEDAAGQDQLRNLRRQIDVVRLAAGAMEPDIDAAHRRVTEANAEVSGCFLVMDERRIIARAEIALSRWNAA